MKVDLVMWTKNGEKTLPYVLSRIDQVIPSESIHKKIIIDDNSFDNTRNIAKSFGYEVYLNEKGGISNGANQALSFVDCEFFCSFEQDLLLSKDWWSRVSQLVIQNDVIAVSGVRFLPQRNFCYNLERYAMRTRQNIDYGRTLDNTIWNTKMVRDLGCFPNRKNGAVDSALLKLMKSKGLRWIVDETIESTHLHDYLLFPEIKRYFFYGRSFAEQKKLSAKDVDRHGAIYYDNAKDFFIKFLKSPASSFKTVLKTHDPRLFISIPAVSLILMLGYLQGK